METIISPHAFSNAPKSYGKHRHPKDHKIKWFHSSSNQLKVTTACTPFHGYNVELGVLESTYITQNQKRTIRQGCHGWEKIREKQ